MNLANITRLHNSISAISFMRRIIALVEDYSEKRKVFNEKLSNQPLHILTVSQMKMVFEGNLLLLLELANLQGKSEDIKNYKNNDLLRVLLPLIKLFSAKCGIEIIGEGMECFGGNGYMENSNIPVILRDSYVLAIWEGTTNVLSVDFLKLVQNNPSSIQKLFGKIEKRLKSLSSDKENHEKIKNILNFLKNKNNNFINLKTSRAFAFLYLYFFK